MFPFVALHRRTHVASWGISFFLVIKQYVYAKIRSGLREILQIVHSRFSNRLWRNRAYTRRPLSGQAAAQSLLVRTPPQGFVAREPRSFFERPTNTKDSIYRRRQDP